MPATSTKLSSEVICSGKVSAEHASRNNSDNRVVATAAVLCAGTMREKKSKTTFVQKNHTSYQYMYVFLFICVSIHIWYCILLWSPWGFSKGEFKR